MQEITRKAVCPECGGKLNKVEEMMGSYITKLTDNGGPNENSRQYYGQINEFLECSNCEHRPDFNYNPITESFELENVCFCPKGWPLGQCSNEASANCELNGTNPTGACGIECPDCGGEVLAFRERYGCTAEDCDFNLDY